MFCDNHILCYSGKKIFIDDILLYVYAILQEDSLMNENVVCSYFVFRTVTHFKKIFFKELL